jgi:hypothetical protein
MNKKLLLFLFVLFMVSVRAQEAIEDNSFLIEEAYNQEKGVVQYINTFYRQRNGDFGYSFTNEMAIKRQEHQFSYTLNVVRVDGHTGFGDTYLNYRYQVLGLKKDDRVALAPRFTLILPTGNYRKGTGTGAVGYQVNVPVSVKLSKLIVTHWNAGMTVTPHARDTAGDRATTTGFNLGESTILLARNRFNVMFETLWTRNQAVVSPHHTAAEYALLLNPGIRWSYNRKNGMQIVPGISAPLGAGPSHGERGLYLYLSFEK